MLTYDEAKALLDSKTRDIQNGIALPHSRKCRIFWAETPAKGQKGSGDIEVYAFTRWTRGKNPAEKRTAVDMLYERRDSRYHHQDQEKVCRILPNGHYFLYGHGSYYNWRGVDVLPDQVSYYGVILTPEAGSPPKMARVPKVPQPFWVPEKFSDVMIWEGASSATSHAKKREEYEANIKRFGSIEKWHEAYHKAGIIRDRNYAKMAEWRGEVRSATIHGGRRYVHRSRTNSPNTSQPYYGAVIDEHGQVTVESWRTEQQRQEEERKRLEEAERKAREAAELARKKFLEAIESQDVKAIFESLSEEQQNYLQKYGLVPNADGTVRMVKAVGPDLCSRASNFDQIKYEIGTKVVDPRYDPEKTGGCGGGLHFCPTKAEIPRYFNSYDTDRYLVVNVDLATLRPVYRGEGSKVVAQWCYVVCEGDETTVLAEDVEQDDEPTDATVKSATEFIKPGKTSASQKRANKKAEQETAELWLEVRPGSIAGDIDLKAARDLRKQ